MNFTILYPNKKEQLDVAWIEVNTLTGNYVIQTGHAPMVLVLLANAPFIYCLPTGTQCTQTIKRGILEVTRNTATLLLAE